MILGQGADRLIPYGVDRTIPAQSCLTAGDPFEQSRSIDRRRHPGSASGLDDGAATTVTKVTAAAGSVANRNLAKDVAGVVSVRPMTNSVEEVVTLEEVINIILYNLKMNVWKCLTQ